MLDSYGHHEHLAWAKLDVTVEHPYRETALQNEEDVIRVVMVMSDELSFDLATMKPLALPAKGRPSSLGRRPP